MLGIVLLILKIIGIILAVVLGILLAVLCLVLFVPVRYCGDFFVADADTVSETATDGKLSRKKDIKVQLKATWFFRLVRVLVSYEETARVQVKILFFTFMDTAKEKVPAGKDKKQKKQKEKKECGDAGEDNKKTDVIENNPEPELEPIEPDAAPEAEDMDAICTPSEEKPGIRKRISNILYTIRQFCDKLKEAKKKGDAFLELWESDHMVKSRSLFGKQLFYLLKHTKPRKLEGCLEFGFQDPSTTGYAMAFYGILYPVWSPKLIVEPDFEKEVLHCSVKVKGRIRACHFAKAGLRLFLSKDVRRVIKSVKNISNSTV